MLSNQIVVRFTFILMTCSSLGLAQRSEPASTSAVGGQIVLSGKSSLKEPVLVLLDHSGSKNEQRTSTDLHGYFEFPTSLKAPTPFAFVWKASKT